MKNLSMIITLLLFSCAYSQPNCEIKLMERPDGRKLKYFNPKPVIRKDSYEVGISIYKDLTTLEFMISVSVLFKEGNPPINLTDDLLIQTTGDYGLRLKPIGFDQVTMNGSKLSVGMYALQDKDVNELSRYNVKSIFFRLHGVQEGANLTENRSVIKNQFNCFK